MSTDAPEEMMDGVGPEHREDEEWMALEHELSEAHGVAQACEIRAEKAEADFASEREACEAAVRQWNKAEDALKALYDKITDWFEVEDWTDPHRGLTEVEAHFNALDKGMEAWSAMTDRVAAAERERDKWHDAVNEYRPAWERETIRADAAEAEVRERELAAFMAGAKFFCDEFAGEYEFWTEHYEAEALRRYGGEA